MTKFECAVDYAWSNLKIGDDDYIPSCMNVGSKAIDLLREFYDNAQSMGVPSEWLMDRAEKLLEEWN
jgi:hypothetical protein